MLPGLEVLRMRLPLGETPPLDLSYYQPSWRDISQVVSRSKSTVVLVLYVPTLQHTMEFPEHIHLRKLRKLRITGSDNELLLIKNLSSPRLSILYVETEGTEGRVNTAIRQQCAFLRSGKHDLRMLQVRIHNQSLAEEEARMVLQASSDLNIPSVDIYAVFDSWVHHDGFIDGSFLTDEFRGARIAAATTWSVIFGWLDLHTIDGFISEFLENPDVNMARVRPISRFSVLRRWMGLSGEVCAHSRTPLVGRFGGLGRPWAVEFFSRPPIRVTLSRRNN